MITSIKVAPVRVLNGEVSGDKLNVEFGMAGGSVFQSELYSYTSKLL